ncbi:OmpP1/FadL family transporter [Parabacteroides distasonis]|uniref:Aromatic hydrocarbon degradation protein n=1 Tax=Parabacteroides distasonis TaxID=823 RepID=A0A5C6KLP1_PARDI|nr:outer membrane protein transport protein [Parabacteroides distasonis]TWV63475.1 aromatic hydrocarbon degradation protein [Parabacteroides distasonis]
MKKVIALACLSMLPLSYAAAEGFQVNAQSTKQAGMGHVGAAMKLGAESMHFNPAGLVFMDKSVDLSVGVSGVFATAKFKKEGYSFETDNTPSTPLYAYAGFKIYDNLAAGVMINTPYGSSITWGHDWAGAHLCQEISLKAFNLQPTVSWKIMDRLSIGAGLMMEFGNISLNRALVGPGEMSKMAGQIVAANPALGALIPEEMKAIIAKYDDASAASVQLKGDAGIRFGFNVGAMYDINEKFTVGVSYRSKVTAKVKEGNIALDYTNETELKGLLEKVNGLMQAMGKEGLEIPPLDKGTFSAELPLPSNLNVGVTYRPTDRWTVSGEVNFVGWGAYEALNVHFSPSTLSKYDLNADKKYKNSRIYRIGGQFAATNRLDVRLGAYFDESPVKDDYLNPETPSMNKLGLTAGLSFRPLESLSVDFSFSYVTGFGRDGSYTDTDLFTQQPRTFGGHYDTTALMPAIGISYAF